MSAAEAQRALGPGEFSGVRLTILFRLGVFYLLITTRFEVMSQHDALWDGDYGVQNRCLACEGKPHLELANLDWHRIILAPENTQDDRKQKIRKSQKKNNQKSKIKNQKSKLLGFCLCSISVMARRLRSLALYAILR